MKAFMNIMCTQVGQPKTVDFSYPHPSLLVHESLLLMANKILI